MLWRVLRTRLRAEHPANMPWLFFFAALAIPAFYAVGLIARTGDHFTVTDFWRFWVVHLWVEDFLELFTTIMVAYIFVLLGVVSERIALAVDPARHHPLLGRRRRRDDASPLLQRRAGGAHGARGVLLGRRGDPADVPDRRGVDVPAARRRAAGRAPRTPFPHRWAVMFLVAVGFWNFLGAGVFGFLINLPIVSYYEIGTALTANHGHAAMMGVYGMLAIGLALFCLRYLIPAERWPERWARIAFWSTNLGLAWMCFATLLPLGIAQLYESVDNGLLGGPRARVPHQRHERAARVAAAARRHRVHRRRRAPGALHHLRRDPPHGQAHDARGARRHPVHRDPRARRRGGDRRTRPPRRRRRPHFRPR